MAGTSPIHRSLAGLIAVAWVGQLGWAFAQTPAVAEREIPESQLIEHHENLEHLRALESHPGAVGEIAHKAEGAFVRHNAREHEYVLPPLTLLPELADGVVRPDMQWALVMADRVKADRDVIFNEHAELIELLNQLQFAGLKAHDDEAVEFARGAAIDALNDTEILEPAVMVVGEMLRARLAPAH